MLPGCFFCWWAVTWAVEIIHFVIDLHQRHLSSFRRDGCLLSCSVRHSYVTTQNGHPQLAASAFHNARVVLFCQVVCMLCQIYPDWFVYMLLVRRQFCVKLSLAITCVAREHGRPTLALVDYYELTNSLTSDCSRSILKQSLLAPLWCPRV